PFDVGNVVRGSSVPPKKTKPWTVMGAARFARDARAATAEHLRTAPIAREMQAFKLEQGFDIHRAATGSREEAVVMLFGGLGLAPPYPATMAEAAVRVLADEVEALHAAQLYVLTPQMCDVVVAAAQTLTAEDLQ